MGPIFLSRLERIQYESKLVKSVSFFIASLSRETAEPIIMKFSIHILMPTNKMVFHHIMLVLFGQYFDVIWQIDWKERYYSMTSTTTRLMPHGFTTHMLTRNLKEIIGNESS